ncbi:carboxymuconolactone decarboxylase family protein (plasmid) [Ensifer adhaerens]|uniref:carboxymuconolactone decarboxylase family protein n=1 Tax=Ensifer adhaerens TaxID=106592 RepID=UPI0023A9E5B4|nr:carboxymuconolactone decarboxylase family protein [Ensifer adhaerens]WDZ81955.1 carboxymuconolactone decarboxylase family protein [Ensifer adhaerens]
MEQQIKDALGPWEPDAVARLEDWDAAWAGPCRAMSTNAWTNKVLPPRLVELIAVAINVACTNLYPEGSRHHIRAALDTGATPDEILTIIKMASVMSIHSCSLGAPILLEEAKSLEKAPEPRSSVATPACDRMKEIGQWNEAWNPFFELDPKWTDQFMAAGAGIYGSGIFTPKETELISIAFDASFTHMYAPGTRRHIRAALKLGATLAEIMEVLKLCVAQGVQACNLAVPILAEELMIVRANKPGTGDDEG